MIAYFKVNASDNSSPCLIRCLMRSESNGISEMGRGFSFFLAELPTRNPRLDASVCLRKSKSGEKSSDRQFNGRRSSGDGTYHLNYSLFRAHDRLFQARLSHFYESDIQISPKWYSVISPSDSKRYLTRDSMRVRLPFQTMCNNYGGKSRVSGDYGRLPHVGLGCLLFVFYNCLTWKTPRKNC
ncbi:hypothetical protein CEXT_751081 [Caerostris extrusa]|uniref:Uncharacterized protein n=1 Tax=Caerostris extrusa TaxID=172846 RepID=A0AAV4U0X4_CAEEX|nr:hypothetical protein CEXT_751081 [Caerostris extrusa]